MRVVASSFIALVIAFVPSLAFAEEAPPSANPLHGSLEVGLETGSFGLSLGASTFRGDGYEPNGNHDEVSARGDRIGVLTPRVRTYDLFFGGNVGVLRFALLGGIGTTGADAPAADPNLASQFATKSLFVYRFGFFLGAQHWITPQVRASLGAVVGWDGVVVKLTQLGPASSGGGGHAEAGVFWLAPRAQIDVVPVGDFPLAVGVYATDNVIQARPSFEVGLAVSFVRLVPG